MTDRRPAADRHMIARRIALALDAAILLLAVVAIGLSLAALTAPRLVAEIPPDRIDAEGGDAFAFGPQFSTHWPYTVPSHPASVLGPDDVKVSEDGKFSGALQPSHDEIRARGGGLYNFWEGQLWFSSTDNSDPRTNGRTYGVRVKTRLAPWPATVLTWSIGAFAVLAACRLGALVAAALASRWHQSVGWMSRRTSTQRAAVLRWAVVAFAPAAWVARRVPLSFGRSYALACVAILAAICWGTLAHPMPLVFEIDSFSYVQPGVLWAAGESMAGQSSRDLGYPALTMLALKLGSLDRIPLLQLLMTVAAMACSLGVLYVVLQAGAVRLKRVSGLPLWVLAPCAIAIACTYCLLLLSHDLFVIDIESAMAEAPHYLPTAITLLLFVLGWTALTSRRRLAAMIAAVPCGYLSIMVKPHTSMVLLLCGAALLVVGLREIRAFRSPAILVLCVVSAAVVLGVNRYDALVAPPGASFGSKTLFCNHLDVEEPVFDPSTPERARILDLLSAALRKPGNDWPVMGFNGDTCMYGPEFGQAIDAAAQSEALSPTVWLRNEFLKAVLHNPLGYGRAVWRQLAHFMVHPVDDVDRTVDGAMPENVWQRLTPYLGMVRMPLDAFRVEGENWMPAAHPRLASIGKGLLRSLHATFAVVTLGTSTLALIAIVVLRGRLDLRLETALLATGAFTLAFALTVALSHTFDIGRYLVDILPFSLLWWVMGVAYLAHGVVLLSTLAARGSRRMAARDGARLDALGNCRHARLTRPGSRPRARPGRAGGASRPDPGK